MQKQIEEAMKDISIESIHDTKELQREVDYYRAQCIADKLLSKGMITKEQYKRLTALNLTTFAPRLERELSCMGAV